jgi:RNA polymerase sigma-B factor
MSAQADAELFRRYRRNPDPALREAIVERFLPLARHLARRYPAGDEREDVLQVASLALVKAVDRFDPDNGAAFSSFATPTILGEIKRYFRDHGWAVRAPRDLQELTVRMEHAREDLTARLGRAPTPAELAAALDTTVERVLEALAAHTAHRPVALDRPAGDGEDEPLIPRASIEETGFGRVDDELEMTSLLAGLTERERIIIELRFRADLLQREIAELLGTSQMQVSRILTHALETLRAQATRQDAYTAAER